MTIPETRIPNLARLRAFDGVALAGTMSRAADRLFLTQPAVTRSIVALERDLRTALLDRTYRGSFLTEDGRIFGRRTRRAFEQIGAALALALGVPVRSETIARLSRKLSDAHLRSLIAIARSGNFRKAATSLQISEPSIHRAARDCEKLIGVPLFRRTADGVALSRQGSDPARRFALAAAEINAGADEIAIRSGMAPATMKIGVLMLAPKALLAMAAEEVLQRYPQARLTVVEAGYDELIDAMRNGQIDFIFGALRDPPPFADIVEEPLFDDPYCIVCRPGHPLTRIGRATRTDLRQFDWIFPTPALPRRAVLDRLIQRWQLRTKVQLETDSLGLITSALATSNRIGLLPRGFVRAEVRTGILAVLDVAVPHVRRKVGITSRTGLLPTDLHTDFLSRLRDLCQQE
jgi:LysR family transcriptional regulator, regulator for genes of the gallate degradation pathway